MIIENEFITLDGKTSGVIVRTVSDDKRKYIYSKENYIRRFKNIEIAKVTARSIVGNSTPLKFCFSIGEKTYPIDNCQKINNHWEVFDNGKRIIINENYKDQVTKLGYIVFENGDTKRCDKGYGINRVNELMSYIKNIATGILVENGEHTINRIEKVGYNQYTLHVKNSTAKINIVTNSRLMDINQARKLVNARCLPFIKGMDKFTTIYVYCSKDLAETTRIGSDETVDNILNCMISDLQEFYPETEPKFVPVEFTGYINISEDDYGKNC